ncbi:MAG: hypothetical protein LBU09_02680 [Endomicrobium sp.]|jgi:hypothetical protein|nr:hypothetical protein [Endomicrobium sp.]
MHKGVITRAFENVKRDKERMNCPIAEALIYALEEYVKQGRKLSELSWFKGLNFEALEE